MELRKIVALTVIGIMAMAISLSITQFFLGKAKMKSESEGKINLSYGIFFLSWVISFSLLNVRFVSVMSEYLDGIYKASSSHQFSEIAETSVLFIGLTNVWLISSYYITEIFSLVLFERKGLVKEIENNHYTFFLMKGFVFIGFVNCLMPVFEMLLRVFLPTLEIPFYS